MILGNSDQAKIKINTKFSPIDVFFICASEYGYILEAADIRSPTFKIRIPKLFPLMASTGLVEKKLAVKSPFISSEVTVKGSLTVKNYVEVENRTHHRNFHLGDVLGGDMVRSVGITEVNTAISPVVNCAKTGAPHAVLPHTHDIIAPFEFYGMKYSDLNNRTVAVGTRVVCEITSHKLSEIGITFIPDAVPLSYKG
jgi:hypothetical protein